MTSFLFHNQSFPAASSVMNSNCTFVMNPTLRLLHLRYLPLHDPANRPYLPLPPQLHQLAFHFTSSPKSAAILINLFLSRAGLYPRKLYPFPTKARIQDRPEDRLHPRASHPIPRRLGRWQEPTTSQPRLPCPIQLCSWSIQGRSQIPPDCQLEHLEVLGFRANLQECFDGMWVHVTRILQLACRM